MTTSRIPGFYKKTVIERINALNDWLASDSLAALQEQQAVLSIDLAQNMIENVVTIFGLPMGIATNFLINNRDYLVPMVIEEPSVVAACSFAAKLVRTGGGFSTKSDDPIMIGQLQLLDVPDPVQAKTAIIANKERLLASITRAESTVVRMGGGPKDIIVRELQHSQLGTMLVIHLLYDTRDAMGANAINTACEMLAPHIEELTGGRVNLRILSNYSDQRTATASCTIRAQTLATEHIAGTEVVQRIVEAAIFAEVDPYRAVTHNKGVMNGIDAVAIATGNDWRAVEAAAHAYAARNGQYTSMTRWWQNNDGDLCGELTLPMAIGIVGGATKVHPTAKLALELLNVKSAQELAEIIIAVGLAQNLAAIRALATEGIQRGHMSLHARQVALAAGAQPNDVQHIANQLIQENNIRLERAKTLVAERNNESQKE